MSAKSEIILIGDEKVKRVSVQESNEPLVDFLLEFPQLSFDLDRHHVQKQSKSISHGRREVGEKLVQAQALLPNGLKLLVKECYRPMWVQKYFWDGYTNSLRKKFPDWSENQIYNECSKLNAPLDVAPHTTGGAVDLTLIDETGRWLDMGTEFNASPLETENATYTEAENISSEAKVNRKILADAMGSVGFVNYPTEWWHWSYGDKYWALMINKPHAIYSSREFLRIQTQNLILRLPELTDVPEILRYFKENESHLSAFDPKKPDGFYTESFWQTKILKHHEAFHADQSVRLYLFNSKNNTEILGTLEFSQIVRGPFQACYLGYGIAKKYEGKGLMYEGIKAAIDYAFGDLNLHRIMANHLPDNHRSAKLLQRLGFVRECVAQRYLRINGSWRDHVLNSLTNESWKETQ